MLPNATNFYKCRRLMIIRFHIMQGRLAQHSYSSLSDITYRYGASARAVAASSGSHLSPITGLAYRHFFFRFRFSQHTIRKQFLFII
jgi:hypothetical protein